MNQTAQTIIDLWESGYPNRIRLQSLTHQFAKSVDDVRPLTQELQKQLGWRFPYKVGR